MTATLAVIVQDIKAQAPDVKRVIVPYWIWDECKRFCSKDWLADGVLSYGGILIEPGAVEEPTPVFEEEQEEEEC